MTPNTEKVKAVKRNPWHRTTDGLYFEVVFKRDDGRIYCLIHEFRKFIQAIQKRREIRGEEFELLWEVFKVELVELHAPWRAPTTFQ
jgi:hypothetical protein